MKTAKLLFRHRLATFWLFQWSVLRTAVDWTVALYILMPLTIVAGYWYVRIWNIPLVGMEDWPAVIPAVAFGLALSGGTLRLFVQEEDASFLAQRREWMHELKRRSLNYSLWVSVFLALFWHVLLLPVWVHIVPGATLVPLSVAVIWFGAAWRAVDAWATQWIQGRLRRLRYRWPALQGKLAIGILAFALLSISPVPIAFCAALIATFASKMVLRARLEQEGTLLEDAKREQELKHKLTGLLLQHVMEKKSRLQPKRPLLFRRSQPLFRTRNRNNAIVEACLKKTVRDLNMVFAYLKMIGVGIFAIGLSPVPMKIIVYLLFCAVLTLWSYHQWKAFRESPFLRVFAPDAEYSSGAMERFVLMTTAPGIMLIGFGWIAVTLV